MLWEQVVGMLAVYPLLLGWRFGVLVDQPAVGA